LLVKDISKKPLIFLTSFSFLSFFRYF